MTRTCSTGDRMAPQGSQLQAVCEVGAPRGSTPARGPILPLPCPGRPSAPHPLLSSHSPVCWPPCSVFIVEDTQGHRRAFTGQLPTAPRPRGAPPTAQQGRGREAPALSPPRWETHGWRGCSGAVVLGCPAERGSGCPRRAAASRWRGLGGAVPRSCPPGAPAGRGPCASAASAAAALPAPRAAAGWATVPAPGSGLRSVRAPLRPDTQGGGHCPHGMRGLQERATPPCVPPAPPSASAVGRKGQAAPPP